MSLSLGSIWSNNNNKINTTVKPRVQQVLTVNKPIKVKNVCKQYKVRTVSL